MPQHGLRLVPLARKTAQRTVQVRGSNPLRSSSGRVLAIPARSGCKTLRVGTFIRREPGWCHGTCGLGAVTPGPLFPKETQ